MTTVFVGSQISPNIDPECFGTLCEQAPVLHELCGRRHDENLSGGDEMRRSHPTLPRSLSLLQLVRILSTNLRHDIDYGTYLSKHILFTGCTRCGYVSASVEYR